MSFGVPDVLRGFRCKCGASAYQMRLWFDNESRPKEFACEVCKTVYVRVPNRATYVEKEE